MIAVATGYSPSIATTKNATTGIFNDNMDYIVTRIQYASHAKTDTLTAMVTDKFVYLGNFHISSQNKTAHV